MTMPCEHCINRRQFLATAAAGAGFVAVGCGDGDVSGPGVRVQLPPGPLVITVADFPALANPGVLVQVPGVPIAVRRVDASTFFALTMVCTHEGCQTTIVNAGGGQRLDCPCHESRFTSDGAVINGPFTGEAIGPLREITTSYDSATDELTIG
jgi:nitrite reductase/ring-hydroxylating ferredoxin subunit